MVALGVIAFGVQVLGRGAFGVCHLVQDQKRQQFAMKEVTELLCASVTECVCQCDRVCAWVTECVPG